MSEPTVAEAAEGFKAPPPEYGLTLWWGWDGPVTPEVIRRDLDTIQGYGFTSVMIEAGGGMTTRYLTPAWFEFNDKETPVKTRVSLAGTGAVQDWDAASGQISRVEPIRGKNGGVEVPMTLGAHGTQCFVVQ